MEDLSLILWRERELLETLLYKLEMEQLVLASGSSRWLATRGPRGRGDPRLDPGDRAAARGRRRRGRRLDRHGRQPQPARARRGRRRALALDPARPPRGVRAVHPRDHGDRRTRTASCSPPASRPPATRFLGLTETADGYAHDRHRGRRRPAAPPPGPEHLTMSGSFASLNTALSRAAVQPRRDGHRQPEHRQRRHRGLHPAPGRGGHRRHARPAPAMWSRNQDAGGGVRVTGVTRMTDAFLDARARTEHGKQSYLDVRQTRPRPARDRHRRARRQRPLRGHGRVPLRAGATSPTTPTARPPAARCSPAAPRSPTPSRSRPATSPSRPADQRVQAQRDGLRGQHGRRATSPPPTRRSRSPQLDGTDAGNLLDQRDQLALRLSELTGGKAVQNGAGGLDFTVNGVALVTGAIPGALEVASGVTADRRRRRQPGHLPGRRTRSAAPTAVPAGLHRRGRRGRRPAQHHDPGVPSPGSARSPRTLADGVNAVHADRVRRRRRRRRRRSSPTTRPTRPGSLVVADHRQATASRPPGCPAGSSRAASPTRSAS